MNVLQKQAKLENREEVRFVSFDELWPNKGEKHEKTKSFEQEEPSIYLVPTPIGNLQEMSERALEILKSVDVIACEDTRNTGKLLKHFDIKKPLLSHHEHNQDQSISKILDKIKEGQSVAIVSDAGYPLISDQDLIS